MQIRTLAKALAFAAAVVPAVASAQLTQVTNRDQIVGSTTFAWSGNSETNPFTRTDNGVTVTASTPTTGASFAGFIAGSSWSGGFSNGDILLGVLGQGGSGSTVLQLTFGGAINAFATQLWYNVPPGGLGRVEFFDGATSLGFFDVATGGGGTTNSNQAGVFGATSTTAFDRVVITSSRGEFAINQLTVGGVQQVVPEPATVALLGGGLALVGVVARRRQRTA
jgi:hypothetical protein